MDDLFSRCAIEGDRANALYELYCTVRETGVTPGLAKDFCARVERLIDVVHQFVDYHPKKLQWMLEDLARDYGDLGYFDKIIDSIQRQVTVLIR